MNILKHQGIIIALFLCNNIGASTIATEDKLNKCPSFVVEAIFEESSFLENTTVKGLIDELWNNESGEILLSRIFELIVEFNADDIHFLVGFKKGSILINSLTGDLEKNDSTIVFRINIGERGIDFNCIRMCLSRPQVPNSTLNLFEIKVPDYIVFGHELIHFLLYLEYLNSIKNAEGLESVIAVLNKKENKTDEFKNSMLAWIKEMFLTKSFKRYGEEALRDSWGNIDESLAVLGYKVPENSAFTGEYIGERLLLQSHFNNKTIVPWSIWDRDNWNVENLKCYSTEAIVQILKEIGINEITSYGEVKELSYTFKDQVSNAPLFKILTRTGERIALINPDHFKGYLGRIFYHDYASKKTLIEQLANIGELHIEDKRVEIIERIYTLVVQLEENHKLRVCVHLGNGEKCAFGKDNPEINKDKNGFVLVDYPIYIGKLRHEKFKRPCLFFDTITSDQGEFVEDVFSVYEVECQDYVVFFHELLHFLLRLEFLNTEEGAKNIELLKDGLVINFETTFQDWTKIKVPKELLNRRLCMHNWEFPEEIMVMLGYKLPGSQSFVGESFIIRNDYSDFDFRAHFLGEIIPWSRRSLNSWNQKHPNYKPQQILDILALYYKSEQDKIFPGNLLSGLGSNKFRSLIRKDILTIDAEGKVAEMEQTLLEAIKGQLRDF